MGEHGTWFDYLNRFSWWQSVQAKAEHVLGRKWEWQMFGSSHFTLTHVLVTLVVIALVVAGALAFRKQLRGERGGLVPPRKMTFGNAFEVMAEAVYGMVEGGMGEKNAARFFPLIGALWLFVLFGNIIGLVPGFISPNDTLKTNLALAMVVFFATHVYGIKEHGLAYFKHFLGPSPFLIPLMLPIEIISHLARPMSLSLRLMGNMVADHKVVFSFFTLVPLFVPLPFLLLGLLVCVVQAIVFCSLTMVYIAGAIEHEDHGPAHDAHPAIGPEIDHAHKHLPDHAHAHVS